MSDDKKVQDNTADEPPVKVFTAEWCGFCKMVKSYLASKNVEFVEVNIEQEPDAATWIQEKTGQTGIPVVLFGGTDAVIGFDRPAIDGYLRELKLI